MALLFESVVSDMLAATVAIFTAVLLYSTWKFDYWKKRGVPYPKPLPIVGNLWPVIKGKTSFPGGLADIYKQYRENGYCGMFQWNKPVLLVYEPELLKQVLTKDFSQFHDRGLPYDAKNDPLTGHLFNLEGTKWRNLRNKLTPTFTSGKLKAMFPLMADVAHELNDCIMERLKAEKELEMKTLLDRYAIDVIGTCAFGIQCNSLKSDESDFVHMSKAIFARRYARVIRSFLSAVHPSLARLAPLKLLFPDLNDFFVNLMKDTVEYREKNKVERTDFVQLMMQLRESDKGQEDRENYIEITPEVMAANGFIFFLAGMESVSNTVSWALHELSLNPELQEQAVHEIKTVIAASQGKITYEGLKQMTLMERILQEALRKYTPIGLIFRRATSTTELEGTGLVVEKGNMMMVPVEGIHKDPDLYPDPDRFDPDRFTEEEKQRRHPYAFLPFGNGPRLCIAERFAMIEMKLPLVSLLANYKFSIGSKTEISPKINTNSLGPTPQKGFWLNIEPR